MPLKRVYESDAKIKKKSDEEGENVFVSGIVLSAKLKFSGDVEEMYQMTTGSDAFASQIALAMERKSKDLLHQFVEMSHYNNGMKLAEAIAKIKIIVDEK